MANDKDALVLWETLCSNTEEQTLLRLNNNGINCLRELLTNRQIGSFSEDISDEEIERLSKEDTLLNHVRRVVEAWAIRFSEARMYTMPPTRSEELKESFGICKFVFNLLGVVLDKQDSKKVEQCKDKEHFEEHAKKIIAKLEEKFKQKVQKFEKEEAEIFLL